MARCTDTTLFHKVCQGLGAGQWFTLGTPVFSTNKTDRHYLTEQIVESGVKHHKSYKVRISLRNKHNNIIQMNFNQWDFDKKIYKKAHKKFSMSITREKYIRLVTRKSFILPYVYYII